MAHSVASATVGHAAAPFASPGAHRRASLSPLSRSTSTAAPFPLMGRHNAGAIQRVRPVAALPLFFLAAAEQQPLQSFLITEYNDWSLDEYTIKNFFLGFSFFFCWGCCVFGSMKDPFYDSDFYRGAGGDGTGHWLYDLEEQEEVENREELWREELVREIEERVGEMREIEESKEKSKELV